MSQEIKESDWQVFRSIREAALDRAYERGAAEMHYVISDKSKSARERFHEAAEVYERRREEISDMFNGLSRSKAVTQLLHMRRLNLVTDEEMKHFSPEMQEQIQMTLK